MPPLRLIVIALLPWAALAVLIFWERRARNLRNASWRASWQTLASLLGHTLQSASDGLPEVHGSDGTRPWVLRVLGVDYGSASLSGLEARVDGLGGKMYAWAPGPRPAGLPELPQQVKTEDPEFDGVFEVFAEDAEFARARLTAPVRRALLSVRNAGLHVDGDRVVIALGADPTAIDEHALQAGLEVLANVRGGAAS